MHIPVQGTLISWLLFLLILFFFSFPTEIQVILEGYLVTNPSNKLSSGKKFYTSEILSVRGEFRHFRLFYQPRPLPNKFARM
jgi:hypothetical protein